MARRKFFTLKNKRHMPTWLAWILAGLVKLIACTYRVTVKDPYGARQMLRERNAVVVLWHNRILFLAALAKKPVCRRCHALISASRDGEYVSSFIRFFGISPIRGSSSRGGVRAMLEMCRVIRSGESVVITVDGPRGPRYTVHFGAVALAQRCGVSLVPVSINAPHKWQLKSWDGMQIPYPFSRIELVFGKPWKTDAEAPEASAEVREKIMEITCD